MSGSGIHIPRRELECSICFEEFVKPLMTKCQHVFCEACITNVRTSICPLCNRIFKREKLVAPLFLNRILEISQPSKMQITLAKFDDATADLLLDLKLVDNREELFLLDAIMKTGSLDPSAAPSLDKFSERAEAAIQKLSASKNHSSLNILFKVIFELACCDREKKTILIPNLLHLLDYTIYSLANRKISRCSLNVLVLIRGFNALKEFLPSRSDDSRPTALEILESMIGLTNDPKFPFELKSSLYVFIVLYSQNDVQAFHLLAKSAALKHAHPDSLQKMAEVLHATLNTRRLAIDTQLEILNTPELKETLIKLNPEEKVVSAIVSALLECAKTVHESSMINTRAVELLKRWLVTEHMRNGVNIFSAGQKQTFDTLITLAKKHPADEIKSIILTALYRLFESYIPSQSCYTTFFNAYQSLLNDDHLNPSLRLILAQAMPLGNLPLQEPPAIMLFNMMLEKIQHPEHPVELTKIYIHKMTRISANCKNIFFVGITPTSNVLNLAVIKDNPEYLQIAMAAYKNKLQELPS